MPTQRQPSQVWKKHEADICHAVQNYEGICLACGAWRECVEPDASGYKCAACGALAVEGAELALLSGRLEALEGSEGR